MHDNSLYQLASYLLSFKISLWFLLAPLLGKVAVACNVEVVSGGAVYKDVYNSYTVKSTSYSYVDIKSYFN